MADLQAVLEQHRRANGARAPMPAARTETLLPEMWLEEAEGKPEGPIVIGLRTPSDSDYQEAFGADNDDGIMFALVCTGICDPNDCRNRHPSFPFADLTVKKLKPRTIRYLFDRIELLHLETSPIVPLADDVELFLLGDALQDGERLDRLAESNLARANRVRRLCSAIIEALELTED
jgi:hypothetical protein